MNQLLTIGKITKKNLFVLKNTCAVLPLITSEYKSEFAVTGAKIGMTVNIRKPPRYEIRLGQHVKLQDTREIFIPLSLTTLAGVDTPFTMAERTLSLDEYTERVSVPKMAAIANKVDLDVLALGQEVGNSIGTPGVTPTALLTYNQAGSKLANLGEPQDRNRWVVMTPDMHGTIVGSNLGIFNPQAAISEAYRTGLLAQYGGRRYYMDQNCPAHTVGALGFGGGGPQVNGAGQSGTALVTDTWTAAALLRLKPGDTFTIANVQEVNPQNRQPTGQLRQFCVMAPGISDAAGNMTITISPAIIPSGPFQNVNTSPADNALLTIVGTANTTYRYGLAGHKGAFGVAFVDLELPPSGVVEAFRVTDSQTGISMSTVTGFDVEGGQTITRTEVLYGCCVLYEDLACRIWQL